MTLQEAARRLNCTHQLISNIERGSNTTVDRLDELSTFLGLRAFVTVYDPALERVSTMTPEEAAVIDTMRALSPRRRMLVERLAMISERLSEDMVGALLALVANAEQQQRGQRSKAGGLDPVGDVK